MREQLVNRYIPREKWEHWQVQKDLKTEQIPRWYQILQEEGTREKRVVKIGLER